MDPAIEFRNVSLGLPDGRMILDAINLTLERGTTTVLLGRSGSGKSTLLRTANRLADISSGQVQIDGRNVRDADLIQLRRGIGYVIQEIGLFPHFTIERNVAVVPEAMGRPRAERLLRSHALLASVGLDPAQFARRYPHQLSGGQRQRVGLARALAAEPKILLMDEPFGALDPQTRAEMQDLLRTLVASLHATILFVTHDLDEALFLGDRIAFLSEGRLLADAVPERFLRSTQPEIMSYIHSFHRTTVRSSGEVHP